MYLWYFRPCPYSQGDHFKDIINVTLPHIEDTVSSTPEWCGTKDAPRISFCRNKCPLKPPLNPTAAVPFPVDATFVISVNLLAQHAVRQPGALRFSSLHFWLVPVSALRADLVPHTISREGPQWQQSLSLKAGRTAVSRSRVRVAHWLCSVPPWAGLGTLRSAITLSHSDVVASAERAVAAAVVGTSYEKVLAVRSGNPSPPTQTIQTTDSCFH